MKQFIFLWLFLCIQVIAQVNHFISTSSITIATPFDYTIQFSEAIPENFQPTFGVFEIITKNQNEAINAITYQIQTFDIDAQSIPSQSIPALNGLPPINLNKIDIQLLTTLPPDQTEFNDILPILDLFYIIKCF